MDETEDATRSGDASATPDAAPIDRDRAVALADMPASGATTPSVETSPSLHTSNASVPPPSPTSHRPLPKGCSFKKKAVQSGSGVAHSAVGVEENDAPMHEDPEFDPNSILDYDETERATRKQQQKKRGRASKMGP